MAEQHIGSILPIKNRVIEVDENTSFLAHYDLNEHDVLKGVKALGQKKALSFDGTGNQNVEVDGVGLSYTVEAWVNLSNGGTQEIFARYPSPNFEFWVSGGILNHRNNMHTSNQASKSGFPYGTWTHVAASCDETTRTISVYINGIKGTDSTVPSLGNYTNQKFNIGRIYQYTGSLACIGKIGRVKVWDRALSEKEIQASMNSNITGKEIGLVRCWNLDEGVGTLARDSSAFQSDGLITNPIWVEGDTVFALKPTEGKFGGGLAIEEGTTNLTPNIDMTSWLVEQSCKVTKTNETYKGVSVYRVYFPPGDIPRTHFSFPYTTTSFTGSIYYRFTEESMGTGEAKPAFYFREKGFGTTHASASFIESKEWQRISMSKTFTTTGNSMFLLYRSSSATTKPITIDFAMPQVEQKSFATSFVEGTRSHGVLGYPSGTVDWTKPWTISLWLKFNATYAVDKSNCVIWGAGVNVKDKGLHILRRSNGQLALAFAGNDLGTTAFKDDALWHHYCFVWDGANQIIYEDGVEIAKRATNKMLDEINTYPHGPNMFDDKTRSTNAIIDEVRIDQIARTPDEIAAWYYSNSPFYPRGIYRKSY